MPTFSRVRAEHVKDLSDQALMIGLEHDIIEFCENSGWATFSFTTENSKDRFDEMARELEIDIEGDSPVVSMLDAVLEGQSPSDIIDALCEKKTCNSHNKKNKKPSKEELLARFGGKMATPFKGK